MNKILIFIIVFSAIQVKAQKDNSIAEVRKNKYQIELGFRSIQNIYTNTLSATILFKKKYQAGDLIDVSSLKFLRG